MPRLIKTQSHKDAMKFYVCCLIAFVALVGGLYDINDTVLSNIAFAEVVEEKFDPFFHDKIKGLISGEISGASADDDGLYNVIMVVNGGTDNEIQENKDELVKLLESIGAKNIKPAVVLAFVTADIPIQEIPSITGLAQIMQIGDGELPVEVAIDKARETIKATSQDIRQIHNTDLTGDGVRVGVIDDGINSVFLNDKVVKRTYCTGTDCNIVNGFFTGTLTHAVGLLNSTIVTHGTAVAQIIAGEGMTKHNGIAPGVDLLDIMVGYSTLQNTKLIVTVLSHLHALDWAITNNVDVVTHSLAHNYGCSPHYTTTDLIYEGAVTRGLVIAQAVGNYGDNYYQSIVSPACARNVITVGGIDDRRQIDTMYDGSGRGPLHNAKPVIKPEIVAPAVYIQSLESTTQESFLISSGTSFSTPMVAAVSALMLEADSTLTPIEVKNLLLLGANWTGPIPCTSSQFEQNNPNDNCSYARQPSDSTRDGIDIINNVGFGILDAQKSINYTLNSDVHMISSYLQHGVITAKNYTITIPDTSQPVKVILNWLMKPPGSIFIRPLPANINFDVICGDKTYTARSAHQTNEFVVFNPTSAGECTVAVTGALLHLYRQTTHHFTLSSTVPIEYDNPLNIKSGNTIVSPGKSIAVPIYAYNPDNTKITYTITKQPTKGTLSSVSFNTTQHALITYTPNSNFAGNDTFEITPVGDNIRGEPGTFTMIAETLPPLSHEIIPAVRGDITFESASEFSAYSLNSPSQKFNGPAEQISTIYMSSTDPIGLYTKIITESGDVYNISMPSTQTSRFNNDRMFTFGSPIKIDTVQFFFSGASNKFDPNESPRRINGQNLYATSYIQYSTERHSSYTEPTQPDPVPIDPSKVDEPDTPEPVTPIPPVTSPPPDSDIISITLPESMEFDTSDSTLDLNTYSNNKIRIDTYDPNLGTRYFINDQADIIIFRNTEITDKTFNYGTDQYCYSGDLRVGTIPGITIPITNVSNVLYLQFREHSPDRCDQSPDIDLTGNLDLDTNVYVRFSNVAGLNPFYSNGTSISPIPKCTTTNFDSNTNTLNNINACYGKSGNDMIIVSKVLSIFGITAQDITLPEPIIIPGNIISYTDYNNIVNGTTPQPYTLSKIKNIFDIMPICNIIHNFDHTISMNQDGIVIQYTTDNNKASDSLKSILVLNTKSESNVLSVNLVQTNQNSTHTIYTSTIPNNIFDNIDSIMPYISDTSNAISKTGIFSNSSTGSPLYYHDGISESRQKIFMNLPNTDNTLQFVNGTNDGVIETVYIPNSNTVSLSSDILCRYATITPKNIVDMFDITVNDISNTTSGIQLDLKFKNNKTPDQLNWIVTNSTDTSTSSTSDTITRNYNLTIPISANGNYDITIYGTLQDKKILGIHNKSYTFNAVIPDPIVIPDPPQVPDPPTRPVQPTNDTDSDVLSIAIPESIEFDTSQNTIDLNTYATNKIRIDTYSVDTGTRYHINDQADIIIFRNTEITDKTFNYGTDQYCYSGDLRVGTIPGITIPLTNVSNVLYLQFREHSPDRCDQAPDIDLAERLILDTEVYVRFANSVDLNPFYYVNGSDNTVDIPKCTDTNFDSTSNRLQNDSMICYGKDGNDVVIISKILAVFGVTVESDPIPLKPVPVLILVPGNIIDHAAYTNLVNTTVPQTYDISNIDNIFSIIPACSETVYKFDHDISMTSDGILIKYTIEKSRSSDSLQSLIVLDDESTSPRTLSVNLVPTGQNSTHLVYTSTISNNLFNNLDDNIDNLSFTSYISSTSSTVHNTGIFSNSSTGSPLFYHNGTSESSILQFMQLPDTDDTVQFVNGTNAGISSTVYIPNGNTVSLSEDILCRYANITPNNIADIFDISPNTISNTTDGLEFALTFADDIPDQINWFATNSTGDIIRGNTVDTITRDYNLTIPLSVSDTYGITIYGTVQDIKILGLHNSSYKFTIPVIPDPAPLSTRNYHHYADIINSTTLIVHEESDTLYKAIPKCDQRQGISHSVIMSSSGDIIIEYSTKRDFADGKVLITIKNDTGVSSSISLDPTFVGSNNNRFNYTSIIPNNILDTSSEHLVVNAFFFSTSNTIKNERVYSTSLDGSPLYYHKINGSDPIIVQLPSAASNVPFVSGTVNGVNDPVYIPKGKSISLTDDLFCEFGFIKPKQIARIYDMNINAANTTDGLEFTYEFERKTFSLGDKTIREPRPSQFNWIVSNSTYNMTGSTIHDIKNTYNFTIPLSQSDDYDVVIYGTNKRGKLIGTHSDSYEFTVKSITQPVTPDPQQPTQPDPPKPVTPVAPDLPQQPSTPNKNDDTNLPILPITLPESYSYDTRDSTIDLNTYATNKIRIDTYISDVGTKYYINNIADITIHRNTEIINKTFAYNADQYCYSGDLKVAQSIPGITIPIANISNVLYLQFREHSPDRCDQAPDIDLAGRLLLDTEVYVRFANSVDLNPFYYVSDSDNTVDIPKCTDTNFDSTSNRLQDDTMICYGKDGNDIVIISKMLAVFGTAKESVSIPPNPVTIPILVTGNIINYVNYINLVNTTVQQTYEISNIDNIFSIIPACSDTVYKFDHDISMTSDGIVIKYTVEKSRSSDSLQSLIVLDDESTSPRTLSLNLVPTGQNSTHLVYTSTIPNSLFNNLDDNIDNLSITSYISSTSNTVHKTGIFSNSSTGSPLFYHNGTSESSVLQFLSLPDTVDTVQFVNGTNDRIRETVYIPDSNTISLSKDILCRYASITPNNVADIFDISPNTISNTTDGLGFALTFTDDIPDQINWFATNSTGNTIRGNTIDTITRDYNLTIPLSISGTYDITIYGTVQDNKIVGLHDNSYEFTMPVIPDPPTMSISLPDSESLDNNDRTIDLNTLADNSIRIDSYYADTGTRYYINDKADITIYRNTMITDKTFTYQSDQYCYVGDLLVGQNVNINIQHTNTLQLSFRQADDSTRCNESPNIDLTGKLVLDKEVFVRFAGTDQTPFYYDGTVHNIPKCTTDNYDDDTSTLKSSEICYGQSNNDIVIVSKILAVFGI